MAKKHGLYTAKLNRNTAMLTVLGCGALGMFLGACKTGKEGVHNLHPIFQNGAVPRHNNNELSLEKVNYRQTLQRARGRDEDVATMAITEDDDDANTGGSIDRQKLEEMRMLRRRTLKNRIEKGHGISDSHGGHWYREPEEEKVDIDQLKQVQLLRRESLSHRIEKGHGLSDSHGGHWYRGTGN
jgi:hypothetical protein